MKPRAATAARLARASLRPANDQGAAIRRALRPSITRAAETDGAPFDHLEILAQ